MKRSNGIFWGGLLLVLGTFWLLRNLGLLQIDWQEVTRFWPVLLILAGVGLLVAGRERGGAAGGVAGILIALAVLGGITHRTNRALDRTDRANWNFGWDSDDDNDDDWNFGDRQERREQRDEERRERDEERARARQRGYDYDNDDESNSGEEEQDSAADDTKEEDTRPASNRHYQYEMDQNLREATLNFEGGAGEFKLKNNTNKLFEADSRSRLGGFSTDIRNNRNANTAVINFKMESGGRVNLKNGENANKVDFSLNTAPIWNIDLGLGAGKADFDLSDYKVKSLKISTGVADLEVKLGDKLAQADVKIESGMASVTLEVPESVGCEVKIDGMLNDKNMGDLQKISDGLYRSPGFERAARKILIRYDAGLSKVNIRRY